MKAVHWDDGRIDWNVAHLVAMKAAMMAAYWADRQGDCQDVRLIAELIVYWADEKVVWKIVH